MAPLPHSDMGSFIPYVLVSLQVSPRGRSPPQPVPLFGHAASSFQLVLASFEPNLYLQKYSRDLVQVILLVHKIYEDETECSETSAHKFQTLENHSKEKNTTN